MRKSFTSNSSFLSALQTFQVLHISMNAQLTHEPIVLQHFQHGSLNVFLRHLFADVISVHNGNMKHAQATEFDYTNLLAMSEASSPVLLSLRLKSF